MEQEILPDGSAFFVMEVDTDMQANSPIAWNPYNKVVQDHRNGDILQPDTDNERAKRGLPIPWCPEFADKEVRQPPVQ